MSEHAHAVSPTTYVIVLLALLALTVLTVAVSFLPVPEIWHLLVGMTIATVKATLVVLFFMHLLHSTRLTWVVAVAGVFWLTILFSLTLSDYFTRMEIGVPGH